MIAESEVINLIEAAMVSLHEGGILDEPVAVGPETVLLGVRSPLDSMSFVALMTELEEQLSRIAGSEMFLLFDEIHAFNPDKSTLTAETLARYVASLPARSDS